MTDLNGIQQFLAAIEEETNRHQTDIRRQTRLFIASELEKAEDAALQESYRLIQNRAAEIRKEQGRKVSQVLAENERQFLWRREEKMEEIVQRVRERLKEFVASAPYVEVLKRSAERMGAEFGQEEFTLFAREEDLIHRERLLSVSGAAALKVDATIQIGGLRAKNSRHTLCLDDTLDTRLQTGKEQLRGAFFSA